MVKVIKKLTYMQIVTILVMMITLGISIPGKDEWIHKYIQVARQKNMQIYQVYKALEEALVEDKQQLFRLKQTFSPPCVPHHWQVDGVDIVPILCSLTIDSIQTCSNVTPDNAPEQHTELSFIWANSLLYALFPVEQLMAMDRIFSKQILDTLMHSYFTSRQVTLSLHLKQLSCKATKDDLFNSLAVLTSWIKAYSQAQGVPQNWEESLLGYVSEYKDLYLKEPYTIDKGTLYGMNIVFLVLFIAINTLIPIVVPCLGHRLHMKVQQKRQATGLIKNIWVGAIVATVLNLLYIGGTIDRHFGDHKLNKRTYFSETTLHFKIFICPVAFTIEMIAAIYSVRHFYTKYKQYCNRSRSFRNAMLCLRVLAISQYYIFVHILFGLIAVPLCVYLFISPGLTLIATGSFIVILLGIHGVILTLVSIKCCSRNPRKIALSCFSALQKLLIIIATVCTVGLYFVTVLTGSNQSSLVKFILSILPAIPLSVAIWLIKRRLFRDGRKSGQSSLHRYSSTESTSTAVALLGPESQDSTSESFEQ